MSTSPKITPMLKQYLEIKEQHHDAILFYRLGDFYEMFFEDAKIASRVLGITLTSRNHNDAENERIPLCGVPYHAAPGYLAKLVKAGYRVAICEQVEDPRTAKGVVKREVVRVVTPGLVTEEQVLDGRTNRYLAAVAVFRKTYGLSLLDLSTGEFLVTERENEEELLDELNRLMPSELLIEDDLRRELEKAGLTFLPEICITRRPEGYFQPDTARDVLLEHFAVTSLAGFGCEDMTAGLTAAGGVLCYLNDTQKGDLSHIERLTPLHTADCLMVDDASRRNLELTRTLIGGHREGSLLHCLDRTCTPMGARLFKKYLLFPLRALSAINHRLDTVEELYQNSETRGQLRKHLAEMYDLERLNSRIVLGSGSGRDLNALRHSLARLPSLQAMAATVQSLTSTCEDLDTLTDIHDLLAAAIREDAPITVREGGMIKAGFNRKLDELIAIQTDGKNLILALEEEERKKTGIPNLKIGFNRVFGYYLEVTKAQLTNVPDYFIRKQTLANAERYITPELKEFENKVSGAEEKRLDLEYQLFSELRAHVATESPRILKAAAFVAELDCFCSLAEVARQNNYIRPEVNEGEEIIITEGRHPVIEQALPRGRFVPNDIRLDQTENEVLIITGPNMAGKSTVLRQTALIVLMAQMGSFVPAAEAVIGTVDRIFTRVGAMDDLRKAQSTFMVEMNETANILNNATEKSLVVLDEIGRGTSTFDGLSIAWAVTEDLVNKNGRGVKTIFATHYHEITDLARTSTRVKNFNIAVREWNDTIIFLHKLLPGGTNRSYGIQVAALAGVPPQVVERAKEILHNIEKGEFNKTGEPRIAGRLARDRTDHPSQLNLFQVGKHPVQEKLAGIQPDRLTPLDALALIYELKGLADNEE
ncbi:MAG: DNA mismatch repair protein MutS [Proteobacteria bacterium]|nr:DNA mismatch repair protein MutS [Pseudomonadota bacterium]MBU1686279.1 DNA mismatch repair protein MutS [Pseudomonadota bacterium]